MQKKDQQVLNEALKFLEKRMPLVVFKADDRVKFFPLIGKILEEQLKKISCVQELQTVHEDELSYIGNSSWGEIVGYKDHYLDPQLINRYPFPGDFRKLMDTVNFSLVPIPNQGRACGVVIFFDDFEENTPGIKAVLNREGKLEFVDENVKLPEKVLALLRAAIVVQYHDLIVPIKPRGESEDNEIVPDLVCVIEDDVKDVTATPTERVSRKLRVAHKRNLSVGKTSLEAAINAWNANEELREEIQPGGKVTWVRPEGSLYELDTRPIKGMHTKFLKHYICTVRPIMQLNEQV